MKYLINEEFVVVAKGGKVTPKQDESIYIPTKDTYPIATMKEIAAANDFKVRGKKTADIKTSFDEALSKLKLAEMKTVSISEEVKKIVQDGHDSGDSENDVLIAIVNSGVKFGQALKQYKNAKIELGLSISNEDRAKKAQVLMEDAEFEPESYDDVADMVKGMTDKKKGIPNTNEKQALAQIRKYCKENDIDMPKKPKGATVPFAIKAMAWMAVNCESENDEFEEWLDENDRNEKFVEAWVKKFDQFKVEYNKQYEEAEAEAE